jgi:phenylacetate-CoA ligase
MSIAWFIRHVIAGPWAWHERSPYLQVAAQLESESALSLDERRERQWQKLQTIIRYAWAGSPFYQKRFRTLGFEPGDLKTWKDLEGLPILTKEDIRNHREEMMSRTCSSEQIVDKKTSGSTGISLNFSVDEAGLEWKRGIALYRDMWTGWKLGEYKASVWGNPPRRTFRQRVRNALLERTFFLDTLRMDRSMMESFAETVLKRNPTLLYGHAHSLYQFAKFWKENQYPPYRFQGAVSTAMVLHEHERNEVEETFETRIFDRYGCEEVSMIASECEAHEGLHLNTDTLVIEMIKDKPNLDENLVVVTDLYNRAMPFIRYEVGDRAVSSDRSCSCRRSYPLIRRVMGRVADYLYTPEGELVSGISLTENFATLIPGVEQFQLIQDQLDHVLVRVVPSSDFDETTRTKISEVTRERFGPTMRHHVEVTRRIRQEATGKYRFTICRLSDREKARAASVSQDA